MGGTTTATSTTLNVGTLAFDVYDTAAKQLVWKGTATKTLNPSKDPKKNQERLQKAMDKLLKNFPPQEKK
jgi:predicted pyridoxine 5'-phosphate oxidase superfamily flavin-nucleotide-binding protein